MRIKTLIALSCAALCFSCTSVKKNENSLTYIIDMVHKNPGEPRQVSKYYNPEYLKEVGYNSISPQIHVQCAITYDEFDKGIIPEGSKEREWIMAKKEAVKKELKAAKEAGLEIYPFTDMLVLPALLVEKYKHELVDEKDLNSGHNSVHGKMAPNIEKEMTETVIKAQLKEVFETFPEIDGLIVRFGETYLYDTPYHVGSSPVRGGGDAAIAGHVKFINLLRQEVCEKYGKKLFYRTWDFGFLHTNADVYTAITDQVEPHENLLFSIKYTRGDFHRLTQFNPTLGIGKHPYIVEFQAQPEYYGKSAHPVYVFGGMLNGFTEYRRNMKADQIQSVAQLKGDPKFQGMWTWSRGGGWRGPYINHELWCDVNAHAAVVWASDTTLTESQVLDKTLTGLGVKESSLADFKEIIKLSDAAVLKGQCTDLDLPFNVWWTRDQYFSQEGALGGFFKAAIDKGQTAEVLAEKDEAMALWDKIVELSKKVEMTDATAKEYLEISAKYGQIKHDIIRQIFIICLNRKQQEMNDTFDKEAVKAAIAKYDQLWIEWAKLEKENPACASIYEPNGFNITAETGVFGTAKSGIVSTIDKAREMVK